ncbi:MAG: hypothetical protein K6F99_09025 [Lachnospiraceae bacterium]|nr:hypothetical protein [Lachnospiraceae bacterium]
MKRLKVLCLLMALAVLAAGCASKQKEEVKEASDEVIAIDAEEAEPEISEEESGGSQQAEPSEAVEDKAVTEPEEKTVEEATTGEDMAEEEVTDPSEAEEDKKSEKAEGAGTDSEKSDQVSDETALGAIKNYCYKNNPDLKEIEESGQDVSWEVESGDDKQVVVLYRSYTGAEVRYYIDRASGETYVTEFVKGITPEEERTEESFNVMDYK